MGVILRQFRHYQSDSVKLILYLNIGAAVQQRRVRFVKLISVIASEEWQSLQNLNAYHP